MADPATGLFRVEKYKPRTNRYTINPAALSFTTTPEGNIILEDTVFLTIELPPESVLLDLNPAPADVSLKLPAHVGSLSWSDIVLVKFTLIFDVEDSIDKEVSDFLSGILIWIAQLVSGPGGIPVMLLLAALIGSCFYIIMAKRRGEE